MIKDYYQVLRVDRDASPEEIKKAYRSQAKDCHPDANGGDRQKEDRFKEINEAYQVLGDSETKRRYDFLCQSVRAAGTTGPIDIEVELGAFLRTLFEHGLRGLGGGCRGRGFGGRGCGRRF
ncbi:MAG: DnaJ domain-containing protein [Proteobacteria bacterium]|nr:DnaJ domain-containing protein [Pseudomonadota bacterium]